MMKIGVNPTRGRTLLASTLLAVLAGCGSDSNNDNGNLPPVAGPVSAIAVIGEESAIDVLAEFTDPEGDALSLSNARVIDGVGEVRVADDLLWFESDAYGVARVEYQVQDSRGGKVTSVADVEVKASLQDYVGTETCLRCHQDKATFKLTGHNFKFNKVVDGETPQFPYTSIDGAMELIDGVENSAGNPQSYHDVTYVIGGYLRRVMFIDTNGYIMSGESALFDVVEKGETVGPEHAYGYRPGDGPDSHSYNCGRCHTTGWRDFTAELGDDRHRERQDDLIGMDGSFEQPGVQCEACHGAGSEHAKTPSKDNITLIAKGRSSADLQAMNLAYGDPIACGECHTKDGERKYPSYVSPFNAEFGGDSLGGRIVEYSLGARYVMDGLLGIDPDTGVATGWKRGFQCHMCHNPHQSTTNRDQPEHADALKTQCQDCHEVEFAEGIGASHADVASCSDCHMPANAHIFKIDLSQPSDDPYHFSADGKFRKPWLRPVESCKGCHQEDYDDLASLVERIHR